MSEQDKTQVERSSLNPDESQLERLFDSKTVREIAQTIFDKSHRDLEVADKIVRWILGHDCSVCVDTTCRNPKALALRGSRRWKGKRMKEYANEQFFTCNFFKPYQEPEPQPKPKPVHKSGLPSPLKNMKRPNYHRLNVYDYIDEFCGWEAIEELLKYAPKGFCNSETPRNFILTAFKTGGRANEVLHLSSDNFQADNRSKVIRISNMALLKHYIRLKMPDPATGKKTQIVHAIRKPFSILFEEALTNELAGFVDASEGLLFPSPYRDRPYSSVWAWMFLKKMSSQLPRPLFQQLGLARPFIDKRTGQVISDSIHLWVHWFRSQRASQLKHDYHFSEAQLMQWFGWTDMKTAIHYAHEGDQALINQARTELRRSI